MKGFNLASASALAMIVSNAPAFAQSAPAPAEAAEEDGGEIIVTAQRQSESLQSVPIAVSAFSAEALDKQQIENPSDLMLTLPNIVYTKGSFTGSSFTIRGVGDLCVGGTCDAATGIHINGSPTPSTRLFETEFFDLERIEVLRGPQGTLFGRNATSGVVNFISAKPDLSGFKASAEAEYGNFDAIKFKGMLNAPIGDTLAVRVAGFYLKRDGYTLNQFTGNKVDDRNQYGLRATIRWEPSPDTSLSVMGYYFREKDSRLRIQKQLCHRDPTGVLGCLPDSRGFDYGNANAQLSSTLPSRQTLRVLGGAALGAALAPLGLVDLYGADTNVGAISPADNRVIATAFDPEYLTNEKQVQATFEHDFGKFNIEVQGMWSKSFVDSREDSGQAVVNRALYAGALNTLQTYATTGIPGVAGSAAFFAPVAAALIPNGPNGVLCTSLPNDTNTGVYGGHRICGMSPISFDRSTVATETKSAEILISSKLDGKFNFLVGGTYLTNQLSPGHYNVDSFALDYASGVVGAATALGRTLQGLATPPSYLGPPIFDSFSPGFRLKSFGIFGEAYFEASDKLKFTAGIRYNHDNKVTSARNQLLNFLVPHGSTDAFASPYAAGYDADPLTPCPTPGNAVLGAYGSVPGCEAFSLREATFSAVTGRAVVDYQISSRNLVYASYSRGYKSGGLNPPLAQGLAAATTFNPEYVNAFEIGSKNTFGNGTFTLNASAFYYQYKAMQISRIVNRTAVNDNVDANIYGLELESIIRPARGWAINMSASYLKTKVSGDLFVQNPRDPAAGRDDVVVLKDLQAAFSCVVVPNTAGNGAGARQLVTLFNGGVGLAGPTAFPAGSGVAATGAFSLCGNLAASIANPSAGLRNAFATPTGPLPFSIANVGITQNIKGKELPQSPNFKWNIGVQKTAELSNGMSIVPRVDLIYVGDSFGNIFNGSINKIKGYSQINAQLQVNGRDDRWFVRGFVQNLTNGSPITGLGVGDQSQGVFTNIFTLEPRRYGIAAGVKF